MINRVLTRNMKKLAKEKMKIDNFVRKVYGFKLSQEQCAQVSVYKRCHVSNRSRNETCLVGEVIRRRNIDYQRSHSNLCRSSKRVPIASSVFPSFSNLFLLGRELLQGNIEYLSKPLRRPSLLDHPFWLGGAHAEIPHISILNVKLVIAFRWSVKGLPMSRSFYLRKRERTEVMSWSGIP